MGLVRREKNISYENSVTTVEDVSTINIGIEDYNVNTDTLIVHKNSVFLKNGVDYTANSTTISTLSGIWSSGSIFDFLVLKNISPSNIV